ncbi:hypothetical protein GQ607_001098 [Colletotrichum asianum]|uniref:DUF6546 domain-containing protein n=1 Tax=Colletotrichum asianum TaxID=702518 RepID=A0A8H3WPS7_9PEZI|nr:hypothetical protein GQ607_001098 [Colletotrichum asianum]
MRYSLPAELKTQILQHIIAQQPSSLAQYATVCRVWQDIIEPILFAEVTLYVTSTSILSRGTTASTLDKYISGPRKRELKNLRLVIDFDPLDFPNIPVGAFSPRLEFKARFVDIIDSFVDTLSKWKDMSFDLEIIEMNSSSRLLLHRGSNLLQQPKKLIECVRSIKHLEFNAERCHIRCSHGGFLSLLCSRMSDNLTELHYGFDQKNPDLAELYEDTCSFVPKSVKSLTIRNLDQRACLRLRVDLGAKMALDRVSMQLEALHVSHYVDAQALFSTFSSGNSISPLAWPNLRRLSITLYEFRYFNFPDRSQDPLLWTACAALEMPRLQRLDVWFPKINHRHGRYFRYWIEGGRAHVLWDMGFRAGMRQYLFNAWDAVARFHTSRPLDTDIRTMNSAEAGDEDPLQASLSFFEPYVPSMEQLRRAQVT